MIFHGTQLLSVVMPQFSVHRSSTAETSRSSKQQSIVEPVASSSSHGILQQQQNSEHGHNKASKQQHQIVLPSTSADVEGLDVDAPHALKTLFYSTLECGFLIGIYPLGFVQVSCFFFVLQLL